MPSFVSQLKMFILLNALSCSWRSFSNTFTHTFSLCFAVTFPPHTHTQTQHIYIIEMMCLISIINRRSLEIDYIWKWLFWFVDWQICSLICAQPFQYVREILHQMRMSRWDSIPSTSHGIYSTVHMISLHTGGKQAMAIFPFSLCISMRLLNDVKDEIKIHMNKWRRRLEGIPCSSIKPKWQVE